MSIVRFNPWREFDELFTQANPTSSAQSRWVPLADVYEDEAEYRIDIELPSVKPEDVEVSVDKGVLSITGELKPASEGANRLRGERRYGRFARSFRLPENVAEDSVSARARDGVLSLVLAKTEKVQPRRIEIAAA